jgi:hypothetical protein
MTETKYSRYIPYLPFLENRQGVHQALSMLVETKQRPAMILAAAQCAQVLRGSSILVSKALSDELQETDLKNITHADIVLLHSSMELCFEDHSLPAMLFYRKDKDYYSTVNRYMAPIVELEPGHMDSLCLDYYDTTGYCHTVQLPEALVDTWLQGDRIPTIPGFEIEDDRTDDTTRNFFLLAVKVFIYCSIPEYAPQRIKALGGQIRKAQLDGKKRPASRVFYATLPSKIVPVPAPTRTVSSGRSVAPHRRRGYLRRLTDERYKAKRGQMIYVRPCLVRGGGVAGNIYHAVERKDDNDTSRILSEQSRAD